MQRLFDFVVSTTGVVLLAPLFAVLALLVKVHDGGPVFYKARRVGKDRKLFTLYKFRSMKQNADSRGLALTLNDDTRITPVGRVLRHYKLDELPQLFNVMKGEMSFVGPRPEDPVYVAHYTAEQLQVLNFRPGITSPASLHYRNEQELLTDRNWEQVYIGEILPHKLAIEMEYLLRRSMWTDLKIIFNTIGGIVR